MLRFARSVARGDIRNGDPNAIQPFVLGSSIAPNYFAYHVSQFTWQAPDAANRAVARAAAIAAGDADGDAAADAIAPVDLAAPNPEMAHVVLTAVYAAQLRLVFPNPVPAAQITQRAQSLAAVRLGAIHSWAITNDGIAPDQVHPGGDGAVATVVIAGDGLPYYATACAIDGVPAGDLTAWLQTFDQSEGRKDLDQRLAIMGAGLYATTGANIRRNGHNCTREHYAYHDAVIKQMTSGLDEAQVQAMRGGLDEAGFRDLIAHKAMHVFDPLDRKEVAGDVENATRLKNWGLGSAALRIPALTDEEAMLLAHIALLSAAQTALTSANVESGSLLAASRKALTDLRKSIDDARNAGDHFTAGRLAREDAGTRDADIAFVGGFVKQMVTQYGTELRLVTQLQARSITRAMRTHVVAAASGAQRFELAYTREEKLAKDGVLVGIGLGMDAPPAAMTVKHWSADIAAAVMPFLTGAGGTGAGTGAVAGRT